VEVDFADPAFLRDPYPTLAALRAHAPVSWHEGTGQFLAASHAAADAVLRDRRLGRFWTDLPAARFKPFNLLHRNQMMENEPPAHTRLRTPVARAFGRGHVQRLRTAVAGEAARLLARAGSSFDVLADLAEPLAVWVIAELLGVPAADRHHLRPWSAAIVRMYEVGRTPEVEESALTACREFSAYVRDLAADRRASPRDDLLSHLVATPLTGDEVVASAILLLNAGHEASVNALGGGIVALLRHPASLARLRAELRAALAALLDHAPGLTLAAEPVQRPTFVLRGYEAVQVCSLRGSGAAPTK
jgi:cytochrome P450